MSRRCLAGLLLGLVLAGCGDEATPSSTPAPSTSTPTRTEPTVTQSPGAPGQVAVADLAKRLGMPAGQITVVSVEEVTWSDSSLGCPQPGMMYAQVLVPGLRIVLETGGQRYHYHAGRGRGPFLCEDPKPPVR